MNTIRIIESSSQGITIEFQPHIWFKDTLHIDGEQYIKLNFLDATFDSKAGYPLIPLVTIPIGIPASGGTKPAAGVIAASPATAPVAMPRRLGRR